MSKHIILGGTGVVGRETARALLAAGQDVASLGRTPSRSAGVESVTADLTDHDATTRALGGFDVAYFTVGLPYSAAVWERDFPRALASAVDACAAHDITLVYFDNVYAYGAAQMPMTESSPVRPSTRKGRLRASLLASLARAEQERGLRLVVARSADFYGPRASTSVFNTFAVDQVAAGKRPTWLIDRNQPHSMTYTPDIGRALAVLGTQSRAVGGTWHLPTAEALTGADYLTMLEPDRARHRTMTVPVLRFGGLFSSAARETLEMAYQYQAPYDLDSALIERTFGLTPTPYAQGIRESLDAARGGVVVPAAS